MTTDIPDAAQTAPEDAEPLQQDAAPDTIKRPSRMRRLLAWSGTVPGKGSKLEPFDAPALPIGSAAPAVVGQTPTTAEPAQVQAGTRRNARTSAARSRWEITGVGALAALVLTIVGVGLFVGMGALQDAAGAAHIDPDAAQLYWIGVDGLIVVAIVAALILRHDPAARRYCLIVIGVFTIASGILQYLHGLGWFTPDPVSQVIAPLPWGVVLLVACLVIGMIFCATHLFVHTLRRLFPGTPADQEEHPADAPMEGAVEAQPSACQCAPEVVYETRDPDPEDIARLVYGIALDLDVKIARDRLAKACGISSRAAGRIRTDVEVDREEAATEKADEQDPLEPQIRGRIALMRRETLTDTGPLVTQSATTTPSGGA